MMIDISAKIEKVARNEFPMEIFSPEIQQSFRHIAEKLSVPNGYVGTAALFGISALSGSMYTTELNGAIHNSIYALMVGESGYGKTPTFEKIVEDIVKPRIIELEAQYRVNLREWNIKKELSKSSKTPFTDPEPVSPIRIIQGGTTEGIMSKAETSSAGFGIYYAEGKRMLKSPNAYKSDGSSIDFWNQIWDGSMFHEVRADATRERFVPGACISVLAGMQTSRMGAYFDQDSIDSGLANRFLFTFSDMDHIDENIDHFSAKTQACEQWRAIILRLFNRGYMDHFKTDKPILIPFTEAAKDAYNEHSRKRVRESNLNRGLKKTGDTSALMVNYDSKLYKYAGRFLVILAILDNHIDPVIDLKHVEWAEKLYRYYRKEAELIFSIINGEHTTDLSKAERELLEALPLEFSAEDAKKIAGRLGLSDAFFPNIFRRKYCKGYIKKTSRGKYEKL